MLSIYVLVYGVGVLVAAIIFRWTIPLAEKFGYIDTPNERKLHTTPVPYGGGVAIFLSLSVSALLFLLPVYFGWITSDTLSWKINLSMLPLDPRTISVALGAAGIFTLGLLDDIYDLRPRFKLFIQALIISTVIIVARVQISFFIPLPIIGFIGTLLWVIFITNVFNLIDTTDGLCSGITLVALGVHFALLIEHNQYLIALLILFVMAPITVFFWNNKPPARLYLGDAGSLMIGYLVAMLSIFSTYYREGQSLSAIFTPLLILAVPLFDVSTVMLIRYRRKAPFFRADKNHFPHRLLAMGMNKWQTLITICSLSLAMGIGALLLSKGGTRETLLVFAQASIILGVILILERAGRSNSSS